MKYVYRVTQRNGGSGQNWSYRWNGSFGPGFSVKILPSLFWPQSQFSAVNSTNSRLRLGCWTDPYTHSHCAVLYTYTHTHTHRHIYTTTEVNDDELQQILPLKSKLLRIHSLASFAPQFFSLNYHHHHL